MSTLRAEHIEMQRSGRAILCGIDLELKAQELTVMIGPNGSGKSSLLKVLAGIETPSGGHVHLDHVRLDSFSSRKLANRRAVLSQSAHLNFPMRNRDVVSMGILNQGSLVANDKLIEKALQDTGISDLRDRLYHRCSGGEQTLVQMSRILVQLWTGAYPNQLLFLDEPTAALDLKYQLQILRLCKELCHQGLTVLCILHDLQLAAHFADTILVMQNGRISRRGTPEQILNEKLLSEIYQVQSHTLHHPSNRKPMMVLTP